MDKRYLTEEIFKLRIEKCELEMRLHHVNAIIEWLEFAEKCGATHCADPSEID